MINQAAQSLPLAEEPQFQKQSSLNEQTQKQTPQYIKKLFKGGDLKSQINQSRSCLLLIVTFSSQIHEQQPQNIQQLFPQKQVAKQIKVIVDQKTISPQVKEIFPTIINLHQFFYKFTGDNQKVEISQQQITLRNEGKESVLIFQELKALQAASKKVAINLNNIQDKLLIFRQEQWKILDQNEQIQNENNTMIQECANNNKSQLIEKEKSIRLISQCTSPLSLWDEFDLLNEFQADKQDDNLSMEVKILVDKMEKEAVQFERKHRTLMDNLTQMPVYQTLKQNQVMLKHRNVTLPSSKLISSFPEGYHPPQFIKKPVDERLQAQETFKFGPAQIKKEQLRMSKQMLKMGYSAEEVIRRLQQIQRTRKIGNINPAEIYRAPSQGPVRPFHIQKDSLPKERKLRVTQGNEREVRVRLIQLLRQKKYKCLEDILKHMQRQGLNTTIDTLRRIVDEIKAMNAEKKRKQNGGKV